MSAAGATATVISKMAVMTKAAVTETVPWVRGNLSTATEVVS